MEILYLVGQDRDGPIHSWTNSHSYLCSRYSRYPIMAIHTWQALKTHKETHCLLETVTFFSPSLFSNVWLQVNNHFEKCAWWVQRRTYRISFGPRDARNSSRTLSSLQAERKGLTRHAQLSPDWGHVKKISVISRGHWKAWGLSWLTLIRTHSISLGTCFSWRSSLSLITLYKNKIFNISKM